MLDGAVAHDRDPRAEGHRLDLVVRHVHGRDAEPLVEPRELRSHVDAQLRVEVRERLVHEEGDRLADDRPAHGDALALAPGERPRAPLAKLFEPEHARDVVHAARDLVLRRLPNLETVGEVLLDGEVGVERVVLEDHGDVALARREARHLAVADPDLAVR